MLSTQAIFKSIALAEQFDAAGVVVKPLGGSPLHHLVESSNITSDMAFKGEDGKVTLDIFRIEQAANAKEGIFDSSRHNYAMADFVNLSASAVQKALYVTRNIVAPRVSELLELVTLRLGNAPVSELSKLQITEEADCPAIYGPNLRRMVDKYANYHNAEPALSIDGPDLGTDEILKYVETGIASIDADLLPWAAALPEATLQSIYRNFFTIKNGKDTRGFFGRIDKSVVNMVLVYCIANHLLENDVVLEGVSLGLKEYRGSLMGLMAQAAHLLSIQMENNDAAIKNGNMVRSVIGNEIRVFPPVYREWLKQGGNTDILYGMAVSDELAFTVDAITDKADKYAAAWNRYSSLITARDSVARMNFLREQLVLAYESIISKPNTDGEVLSANAIKQEMDAFREVLRGMNAQDADDLHQMCLKLVCRGSFPQSPAEFILTRMDEEAKRNPKLSPREAGAVAVLEYIASWVAALLVVESV
jgi:hypothetical protein